MIQKVNLSEKFGLINDHWNPRIAGVVNDFHVKLVKLQGEFVWHHHDDEDELFLVVDGSLTIRVQDQPDVVLHAGEFVIIPRGVEHQPFAEDECQVMLFEPAGTLNTGNVGGERTVATPTTI